VLKDPRLKRFSQARTRFPSPDYVVNGTEVPKGVEHL